MISAVRKCLCINVITCSKVKKPGDFKTHFKYNINQKLSSNKYVIAYIFIEIYCLTKTFTFAVITTKP